MLILHETPAGFALFQVKDENKVKDLEAISAYFESAQPVSKLLSLKAFNKFENTGEAVDAAASIADGRMSDNLKEFLKKNIVKKNLSDTLCVADPKLGAHINKKLGLSVLNDSSVMELYRGIREQVSTLLQDVDADSLKSMTLGLSHSLSRHKIKFSADKVDTMVVQAISLLDDLDKELNTYSMRLKEWYGWHFPEMTKVISDNVVYAKIVRAVGLKTNITNAVFDDELITEDVVAKLKAASEISMGTEISDEDLLNINHLAEQVVSLAKYRAELYDYLANRMKAIAPNLTEMVGELVGARLISHAGSLMNLAKQPASTVQILGAEKALFRALKAKHDTPKYGLIYHASVVGQAAPKLKGKISRVLAAKTALAIRVDALSEKTDKDSGKVGVENRIKVEERLKQLELEGKSILTGAAKSKPGFKKVEMGKASGNARDFNLEHKRKAEDHKEKSKKSKHD